MERKIGEIFEYNGEWYQCIEQPEKYDETVCSLCAFRGNGNCELDRCCGTYRSDKKSVIFKKLEKVGGPYMLEDIKFQKYKVFKTPYIYHKTDYSWQSFADPYYISLEIKQTKEDMEEKKLNLKPFNLEKAKQGKPVCTRDGRNVRIVCFDAKCDLPIIALVTNIGGSESLMRYYSNGNFTNLNETGCDLMMISEKKEGWVNVYKGGLLDTKSYPTKKEAFNKASLNDYIDTIKIEWEE